MRFTAAALSTIFLSTGLSASLGARNCSQNGGSCDMEKHDYSSNVMDGYGQYDGAICKNVITVEKFPNLLVPKGKSGCVRYYQGIDMTGVVTEVDLYAKDGIISACDCIAACLERPLSCTSWVYKHTFVPSMDDGLRSCTLYSNPNLPTNVTLSFDLGNSTGYSLLRPGNNPQPGGAAPLTFMDANMTTVDPYGVSGFMTQDQNNKQYC